MEKRTILITGYYGQNNLGDDYILLSLLNSITKIENYSITVIVETSNRIFERFEEIVEAYSGKINILPMYSAGITGKVRKVYALIKKIDIWIVGGGGLFTNENVLGIRHLLFYTSIASVKKIPICMYGIDIESATDKEYISCWKKVIKKLDFIYTRNKKSATVLKKIGGNNVFSGSDITNSLILEEEKQDVNVILEKMQLQKGNYIIWALAMPWSEKELQNVHFKQRYLKYIKCCSNIINNYPEYKHVLFPFFKFSDTKMFNDLVKFLDINHVMVGQDILKLREERFLFSEAKAVVSMRFHGLQFALFNKKPCAVISYSNKINYLLEELKLMDYLTILGIRNDMFFNFEEDIDEIEFKKIVDKVIYSSEDDSFSKAANYLYDLANEEEKYLIKWIENMKGN